MPPKSAATAASCRPSPTDAAASSDYSQHWSGTLAWLESLRLLVECEADFSALKFAKYLEAEQRLFRGMPELRAVCQEARLICRREPRASGQVAARIQRLQSTWLAIESRLAEFKSQRNLLTALSGDLKLLEARQASKRHSPRQDDSKDDHICCTRKIEILDDTVQKKADQMQQMLGVTSAISKLLDWVCSSELLLSTCEQRQRLRDSHVMTATPDRALQSVSSTGSTTYLRTHSNTDGDPVDSAASSDSSEILAQTGFNGFSDSGANGHNDNHSMLQLPSCGEATNDLQSVRKPIARNSPLAGNLRLSPLLQSVGDRIAEFKSSTESVQVSLDVEAAEADATAGAVTRQLSQVAIAEATLSNWQMELQGLRASVQLAAVASTGPEEAVFRRAYLESIALLANWTGSLRDRFRAKRIGLQRTQEQLRWDELAKSME